MRQHNLDITSVIDREEIASSHGQAAAWRATIVRLRKKEAQERNPQAKRRLRLMLLNAETQLSLHT